MMFPKYSWLRGADARFWQPPISPAALLLEAPPLWVVYSLLAGLAGACIWLASGKWTVAASLVVAAGVLALDSIQYAYGKIDHAHLLLYTPLILCAVWGRRDEGRATWQISLLALVIALMMFYAGYIKLRLGWLPWESRATLGHILRFRSGERFESPLVEMALQWLPLTAWKTLDYATIAMEMGGVVAWLHYRVFRWWLLVAVVFHIAVLLTLGIFFWFNLLAYAAFVPWSRAALRLGKIESVGQTVARREANLL
jgi:hypothetical protein